MGFFRFAATQGAPDVVKISAIDIGMRSHSGVAARAFTALAEKGGQHPRDHHLEYKFLHADRRGLPGTRRRLRCTRCTGSTRGGEGRSGPEGSNDHASFPAESGNIRSREQIACPVPAGSAPCPFDWGQGIWRQIAVAPVV